MAFTPETLSLIAQPIGGVGMRLVSYRSDDAEATITATGYFVGATQFGVRLGDLFFVSPITGPVDTYIVIITAVDANGDGTAAAAAVGLTSGDIGVTVQAYSTNLDAWSAVAATDYLTTAAASSTYLTQASAASTYLTQANAASTYLTSATAASTYLTSATAASTYLTQANAATTYQAIDPQLSSLIRQNSQSAAYELVLTDGGKHILHPSADTTARTWTIPANGSVAFPVGTAVTFINQNGAGVITIAITSDTMRLAGLGTTGNRTLAANGIATAIKITSTEWIISGTGLT